MRQDCTFTSLIETFIFRPFGLITIIFAFFSLKRNLEEIILVIPSILLIYSQLLIAVNYYRLLFLAFPLILPYTLEGVKELHHALNTKPYPIIGLGIMIQLLILFSIDYISQSLVLLIYIGIILFLRPRKKEDDLITQRLPYPYDEGSNPSKSRL